VVLARHRSDMKGAGCLGAYREQDLKVLRRGGLRQTGEVLFYQHEDIPVTVDWLVVSQREHAVALGSRAQTYLRDLGGVVAARTFARPSIPAYEIVLAFNFHRKSDRWCLPEAMSLPTGQPNFAAPILPGGPAVSGNVRPSIPSRAFGTVRSGTVLHGRQPEEEGASWSSATLVTNAQQTQSEQVLTYGPSDNPRSDLHHRNLR